MTTRRTTTIALATALLSACSPVGDGDVVGAGLLAGDDHEHEHEPEAEDTDESTGDGDDDGDPQPAPLLDLGTTGDGDGDPGLPPRDCGNKVVDPGEVCDFRIVGACTCEALGFTGGWLSCDDYCEGLDLQFCEGEAPAELDLACLDGEPVPCIEHVDCAAFAGPCSMGVCTHTGCASKPYVDGLECEDGDACTWGSSCSAGECVGGQVLDCSTLDDECALGICNPDTGACEVEPIAGCEP